MNQFNYEVVKHIGTLESSVNGNYATKVKLISYNGNKPKVDIRRWNTENDTMCKGLALTEVEAVELAHIILKEFQKG